MLLSITTTHQPATDLGFLLHKHPENVRTVSFPFGEGHVFFPEASEDRCTATLLVEVDPVGLVRGKGASKESFALAGYVNDRPYVASSFTSVVIAKVFGTAMTGRCESRPQLAASPIPIEVEIPVLPCSGGEEVLRRCFEPLGYEVGAVAIELDERFPDWGSSRYLQVVLRARVRVADLLSHLYVLLPVLLEDPSITEVVGTDVSHRALERAAGHGAPPENRTRTNTERRTASVAVPP
jgi:3' terminal RNA ribose 2'-O-methyltransferase Hen1